ncbi:MAG TPA: hypothetical protein VNN22_06380 [Verrucomicrobiae bacterium]|nr:hypothetical protein [Verrucomicrobiae bacterium]
MKPFIDFRFSVLLATSFGAVLLLAGAAEILFDPPGHAQEMPAPKPSGALAAPAEMQTLNDRLPDQSHAMQDAGYHFENLWFAGDKQNWPLASYYLRKTQSYLELAVRIKPVRKTQAGEVNLKGILDAVNNSLLAQVDQAITNKDVAGFRTAYRQTIEGCNACHTACEKSYIRLQVPTAPSTSIIKFDPPPSGGK